MDLEYYEVHCANNIRLGFAITDNIFTNKIAKADTYWQPMRNTVMNLYGEDIFKWRYHAHNWIIAQKITIEARINAMVMIDKLLYTKKYHIRRLKRMLMAVLLISSKFYEDNSISVKNFKMSKNERKLLVLTESNLLAKFDWHVEQLTPYMYLANAKLESSIYSMATKLLVKFMTTPVSMDVSPATLAMICIYYSGGVNSTVKTPIIVSNLRNIWKYYDSMIEYRNYMTEYNL